jgi:AraC-like DNA-binding protein/quercetin dioxygenase-like cupin family protein
MMPKNIANQTFHHAVQSHSDRLEVDRPVVVHAQDYPAHWHTEPHWHARHQLVYASAGVMMVETEQGMWVVPPQRAVWIPASVRHQVRAVSALAMRSVYMQPDAVPALPTACCVVNVTPLLRELIVQAAALPALYASGGRHERLMLLMLDEIRELPVAPLHLPEPTDPRLRRITTILKTQPADSRTLDDWGREVGASPRTLARLFRRDTGMGFQQWQRQMRLLAGLVRLAAGQPVTVVAMEVGYESPSAFIAMFKRALGTTPNQYFHPQSQKNYGGKQLWQASV